MKLSVPRVFPAIGIPEKFTCMMITETAAVVLGIIIYFLNKRAVKKGIILRLNKVRDFGPGPQ